jgi:transcriptional regulator with XRE-family HTH domain
MSKPNSTSNGWLDRHLADPANRLAFEEEYVVVDTSERLLKAVETSSLSRAKLAELLKTSRANVTQLLNGRRNLTLRTLARIAFFLGYRIRVFFQPLDQIRLRDVPLPELPLRVISLADMGEGFSTYGKSLSQTDNHHIGELAA